MSCSLSRPPHWLRPMRRMSSRLLKDTSDWIGPTVIGMLFDERNENLVRERTRLPEPRVGTDDDIFVGHSPIEFDLLRARRRAFGIMAKKGAGNAQKRVLHVELVARLRRLRRVEFFSAWTAMKWCSPSIALGGQRRRAVLWRAG